MKCLALKLVKQRVVCVSYAEAGDVATAVSVIRETLSLLKEKFEEVFYCPGWGQ